VTNLSQVPSAVDGTGRLAATIRYRGRY